MRLLERILFPTDFGSSSQKALETCIFLAKTFSSKIHVIHVLQNSDPESAMSLASKEKYFEERIKEITELESVKDLLIEGPHILTGNASDRIIHYAEEQDINVIVLGAGEKKGKDPVKLGVTAERVVRNAKTPVWIVQQGQSPQFKKILCPVDFSDSSFRSLQNAVHLSRKLDAELHILHVIKPAWGLFTLKEKQKAAEREKFRRVVDREFEKFISRIDTTGVKLHKNIIEGIPSAEILRFLKKKDCDLLIMGTVGKTGLERILIGSVSLKVLREVPVSMVLIREQSPIRYNLDEDIRDLSSGLKKGIELLENGFPDEAVSMFKRCIEIDKFFPPAWESLAAAYERLKQPEEAKSALKTAKELRQNLWEKQVEYEVRKERKFE